MLITPTLNEVELQASKIALPNIEAQKFWHFYESKNWFVGKSKMKSWHSALAGWKLRWQERRGQEQLSSERRPFVTARQAMVRESPEQIKKFYDRLTTQ